MGPRAYMMTLCPGARQSGSSARMGSVVGTCSTSWTTRNGTASSRIPGTRIVPGIATRRATVTIVTRTGCITGTLIPSRSITSRLRSTRLIGTTGRVTTWALRSRTLLVSTRW
uniref:Uncharacterized protein n=1 Tax=Cacopsylla melanoneura TaxID=428564 RepID=A0A8D9BSC2_9HEMI